MAAALEQFEKVPIKQRGLILLMLCALVGVGFWYLVYQPKAVKIGAAQTQLATLTSEVQNLQTIEAKNKEFKRMIAELTGQLDAARQQLPGEREIPILLEQIALFGKEAGSSSPGSGRAARWRRTSTTRCPWRSLRGPFHNIGVFLDKISHYPRIISVLNRRRRRARRGG